MNKKRIFSGIQPTGSIHIGNYLGAIKQWVKAQNQDKHKYENIFCIVNAHAITIKQDPKELYAKSLDTALLLLACGIDTNKSSLFIQSQVSEHFELSWILSSIAPMGDMSRMTQFKDKSKTNSSNINMGLFSYPVLMAADILLYKTDLVPVGEDQKQHIELTRDLAQKFNKEYKEVFIVPKPQIPKINARVMGLDDPNKKMSKSTKSANHAIYLLDSPDVIKAKLKRATTDSKNTIAFDENRAGVYNLLCIYQSITGQSQEYMQKHFSSCGYKELKEQVADIIIEELRPIREKYNNLKKDIKNTQEILHKSKDNIQQIAQNTLKEVKEAMGLI